MSGQVRALRDGAIGWLIFDHEARRNAISVDMWAAIPDLASELNADGDIRVVVLRGSGEQAFVSGADISEFERTRVGAAALEYDKLNSAAYAAILAIEKPVIAMIHGFCFGGGSILALTADLRFAASDAVFAVPAAKLGLGYPLDGIRLLENAVGAALAKEILFTGERLDAERALRIGLVNDVLPKPELEVRVRKICEQIAINAPLSLRGVKLAIRELGRDEERRDMKLVERALQDCFHSKDYKEGVRAFLEKRTPTFTGE